MQDNQMYQTASAGSTLEINKVLKNTYTLLAMTLAFSAVTALSHAAIASNSGGFAVGFDSSVGRARASTRANCRAL